MTKFFKILAVLFVSAFLTVSCNIFDFSFEKKPEIFITAYDPASKPPASENSGKTYGEIPPDDEESNEALSGIKGAELCKFENDFLWIMNPYKGLMAIKTSTSGSMKISGRFKIEGELHSVYCKDNKVFVFVIHRNRERFLSSDPGVIHSESYSEFFLFSSDDPSQISPIDSESFPGEITHTQIVGDNLYVVSKVFPEILTSFDGEKRQEGSVSTFLSWLRRENEYYAYQNRSRFEGDLNAIYGAKDSIYVAETDPEDENSEQGHSVIKVLDASVRNFDSIELFEKAVFKTEGSINDTGRMFEKDGVFYAVTSSSSAGAALVESFDISNTENIRELDKLPLTKDQVVSEVKFEEDRIYISDLRQEQNLINVVDISDPEHLALPGDLQLPDKTAHTEIFGTKLLAFGENDGNIKISMYDVPDPGSPVGRGSVEIALDHDSGDTGYDWKSFKISEESGLMVFPFQNKLHLVDFDSAAGLKKRGVIEWNDFVIEVTSIGDFVFAASATQIMSADINDRDKPVILHETVLADKLFPLVSCGIGSGLSLRLCGFDHKTRFRLYSDHHGTVAWESSESTDGHWKDILINGSLAVIFWQFQEKETEAKKTAFKIIKFNDQPPFEETGEFVSDWGGSIDGAALSDNNVIAMRSNISGSEEGKDTQGFKLTFFDMNDPHQMEFSEMEFKYKTLKHDTGLYTSVDSTFWTSGCEFKGESEEKTEEYICYAFPVDVSDPKNPKLGKKLSIPGELIGSGYDYFTQAPYLYSVTQPVYQKIGGDGDDAYKKTYDFYIYNTRFLRINRREIVETFGEDVPKDGKSTERKEIFIKGGEKWFIVTTRPCENCGYYPSVSFVDDDGWVSENNFRNVWWYESVQNGGFLVMADTYLSYFDGSTEHLSYDFDHRTLLKNPLLFFGTIYASDGFNGIYALDFIE